MLLSFQSRLRSFSCSLILLSDLQKRARTAVWVGAGVHFHPAWSKSPIFVLPNNSQSPNCSIALLILSLSDHFVSYSSFSQSCPLHLDMSLCNANLPLSPSLLRKGDVDSNLHLPLLKLPSMSARSSTAQAGLLSPRVAMLGREASHFSVAIGLSVKYSTQRHSSVFWQMLDGWARYSRPKPPPNTSHMRERSQSLVPGIAPGGCKTSFKVHGYYHVGFSFCNIRAPGLGEDPAAGSREILPVRRRMPADPSPWLRLRREDSSDLVPSSAQRKDHASFATETAFGIELIQC